MRKNIFVNTLVAMFMICGVINCGNINYIKNPEKRPLRTSPYVTEVNLQFK
ncbi:MAG: hypothetical protein Q4B63_01030 [Clostridium perfringens]|nr:hypothetical protein [Clostridium perfringens]